MRWTTAAACLAVFLMTGLEASAQNEVRVQVTLKPGQVRVVSDGAYHRIELTGVRGVLQPERGFGLPGLPAIRMRVALPAGAQPGKPRLVAIQSVRLPGRVRPAPVQPPRHLAEPRSRLPERAPARVPANALVYRSMQAYPPNPVTIAQTARMGGAQVAFVHVTPFRLTPKTGALEVYTRLTVVVPYTLPSGARPAARAIPGGRSLVVNPSALPQVPALPAPVPGHPSATLLILTSDWEWKQPERGRFARGRYVGDMVRAFRPLAEDHTALGLQTKIVRVGEVVSGRYGDFRTNAAGLPARDLSELLRNFIQRCAYPLWGTRYLLLGGDVQTVPTRHILNTTMDWHWNASTWTESVQYNTFSAICRSWWPNCNGTITTYPSSGGAERMVDGDVATGWVPPSPFGRRTRRRPGLFQSRLVVVEMRIRWSDAIWPAYNKLRMVWDSGPAANKPILLCTSSDDGQTWTWRGSWPTGASELVLDRGQWIEQGTGLRVRLFFPAGWPTGRRLMELEAYGAKNTAYPIDASHRLLVGSGQQLHEPLLMKNSSQIVPDMIPYNPSASVTAPGWHYVNGPNGGPNARPMRGKTRYVMVEGPTSWLDGATHWTKAVHPVYYAADAYFGDVEGAYYASGVGFDPQNPWHDFDKNDDGWCSPWSDGIDSVFEIGVGRAPVHDPQQAALFVKKARTYLRYRDRATGRSLGDFARRGLLGAKKLWHGATASDEGYVSREHILNAIWLADDPSAQVARYYEHTGPFPGSLPVTDLVSAFNQGWNRVGIISHSGPAYCTEFRPQNAAATTNAPFYSVMFSYGCSPNAFDYHDGDSVTEALLNAQAGGACAFTGNSRYGWSGDYVIENAFWEAVRETPRLGDMLHAREARSQDAPWLRMNLLGDPALPVWSRVPKRLTVRATALSPIRAHVGRYRVRVTRGRRRQAPVAGALVAITGGGRRNTAVRTNGQGYATFFASSRSTIGVSAVSDASHPGRAFVPVIRSLQSLLPPRPIEAVPEVRR